MKLLVVSVALVALAAGAARGSTPAPLLVLSTDYTPWSDDHAFAYAPGERLRALALGSAAQVSPDGQLVAFVRDGALWTAGPDGRAQRRVASLAAELSYGASLVWSQDGRHLAVPVVDGTELVDLSSGAVASVDTVAAAFSPDGEHVAYVDRAGLEVADSRGASPHVVAPGWEEAGGVAWSRDARWIAFVAYGQGGAHLVVVRPDGSGLHAFSPGRAFPSAPAWSRDGRVAWISAPRVLVARPGGGVRTIATIAAVGYPEPAPAWSGDDRLLAVRVRGARIALVPANGGRRRVVDPPAPADALVGGLSWHGSSLVFTAHRMRSDTELALIRTDGTGFRELTSNAVADRDPAWSPDGRSIAFVRFGARRHGIYVISASGGTSRRLTNGDDRAPSFSPDGLSIAFVRDGTILLLDVRTGTSRELATTRIPPRQLSWTKDGRSILFGDEYGIKRVDVRTGRVQPIDVGGDAFRPVVSPDGTRFAFLAVRDERYFRDPTAWGIFLASIDGTNIRRLTSNDKFGPTSWSPDGTRLVAGDGSRLELVDAATGGRRFLLTAGHTASAAFQP